MAQTKRQQRQRIKKRVRGKITGTAQRPRLSVFRSNTHISAQLIDDAAGHTLAAATSQEEGLMSDSRVDTGKAVGKKLAERAGEAGITSVVFDRNGYRYHGRVKALAEGAREGGLQF
jgi:large subunit ribosomal protein L18